MCTMTHYHTETLHTSKQRKEGGALAWKAQRERLIHFDRGPDGYPSSSFFRFDDGAKLKKRDLGDVSYLEKSVSYLQKALNQINTKKRKSYHICSFSLESYFPIFFSLEITLYSEGEMPW